MPSHSQGLRSYSYRQSYRHDVEATQLCCALGGSGHQAGERSATRRCAGCVYRSSRSGATVIRDQSNARDQRRSFVTHDRPLSAKRGRSHPESCCPIADAGGFLHATCCRSAAFLEVFAPTGLNPFPLKFREFRSRPNQPVAGMYRRRASGRQRASRDACSRWPATRGRCPRRASQCSC